MRKSRPGFQRDGVYPEVKFFWGAEADHPHMYVTLGPHQYR